MFQGRSFRSTFRRFSVVVTCAVALSLLPIGLARQVSFAAAKPTATTSSFSTSTTTSASTTTAQPRSLSSPATYAELVANDHPTRYYRMGDSGTNVPPGGSVATDSSSTPVNGTYIEGAVLGQDGALKSDSNTAVQSAYPGVLIASDANLPSSNAARTVEVWHRTGAGETYDPLVSWGSGANTFAIGIKFYGDMFVTNGTTTVGTRGVNAVVDNRWHHLVVTYDGSSATAYFDSVRLGTVALAVNSNSSQLLVGRRGGMYDEVAIYPGVLPESSISSHWTMGMAHASCAPDPTDTYGARVRSLHPSLYYRLDERQSDPTTRVAMDSSGNCRNGNIPPANLAVSGIPGSPRCA